jgi:peptidoglycan-associated lipoprotein
MRTVALAFLAGAALLAAACAHKPPAPPPPEAKEAPVAETLPPAPVKEAEPSCVADRDCRDGNLCLSGRCAPVTGDLQECAAPRVHFDFDSSILRGDDRPALERIARCLRASQAMRVTIEGNADERGTEEYNLQLGQRRAAEVERYLVALGASGEQLKTISYGYEKPLCNEHNEECWSKNRRAGLTPTGPLSPR